MVNEDADLKEFTISQLLDALYMIRTGRLDSPDWKMQQAAAKATIVAELESRPVKELVAALIAEASQ